MWFIGVVAGVVALVGGAMSAGLAHGDLAAYDREVYAVTGSLLSSMGIILVICSMLDVIHQQLKTEETHE